MRLDNSFNILILILVATCHLPNMCHMSDSTLCFSYIYSFNPHNSSVGWIMLLASFYREVDEPVHCHTAGKKWGRNSPQKLVKTGNGSRDQRGRALSPRSHSLMGQGCLLVGGRQTHPPWLCEVARTVGWCETTARAIRFRAVKG